MAKTKKKEVPTVVISIHGGVADVVSKSKGINLHILDYDNHDETDERNHSECPCEPDGEVHSHSEWEAKVSV